MRFDRRWKQFNFRHRIEIIFKRRSVTLLNNEHRHGERVNTIAKLAIAVQAKSLNCMMLGAI